MNALLMPFLMLQTGFHFFLIEDTDLRLYPDQILRILGCLLTLRKDDCTYLLTINR